MRKLVLLGMLALAASGIVIGDAEARPARREYVQTEYARKECILPWYRFFGYCPEAIDAPVFQHGERRRGWNSHGFRSMKMRPRR